MTMSLNRKIKIRYQDDDRDDCGAKSIQMAAEYILGDLTEKQYSQIAKGRMRIDRMKEEIKKLGLNQTFLSSIIDTESTISVSVQSCFEHRPLKVAQAIRQALKQSKREGRIKSVERVF